MFKKKDKVQPLTEKTKFPKGTAVECNGSFYYIQSKGKRQFVSKRAMESWNFPRVIRVETTALQGTPTVGYIGFRDGAVLRDFSTQKLYLIVGQERLHIVEPDVIKKLNIKESEIINVTSTELKGNKEGLPLARI